MKNVNNKEESGWLVIAEKSLASMWGNEKDGRIWNKYLNKIDI